MFRRKRSAWDTLNVSSMVVVFVNEVLYVIRVVEDMKSAIRKVNT